MPGGSRCRGALALALSMWPAVSLGRRVVSTRVGALPAAARPRPALRAPVARGGRARAAGLRMMYSDSRPTIEYMEFLRDGEKYPEMDDCPSAILGAGRIGQTLYELCGMEGDILLKRGDPIPEDFEGPIYVATRNDDLAAIIDGCPESKRDDLVFLQNPMIEPLLKRYAMTENSQVNIYFAVPKLGAAPIDGLTDTNPEGLTSATGKWAYAMQQRLARGELSCKVLNKRDFRRANIEKHIWLCAFMVIGTAASHMGGKPLTVGQVEKYYSSQLETMVRQLGYSSRTMLSAAPPNGLEERLRAYARAVEDFPTAMKEFKWRNGFWYNYSQLCVSKGFDDPMELHTEYVQYCIDNGLVDVNS